ncbi:hypothetical protein CRU87_10885, partial [Aliarcobacter trophiarum LMG 25534]
MRLFIAEKPTLVHAIADALPKPHKKGDGFIQTAQRDVITCCIDHLLAQTDPTTPLYTSSRFHCFAKKQ